MTASLFIYLFLSCSHHCLVLGSRKIGGALLALMKLCFHLVANNISDSVSGSVLGHCEEYGGGFVFIVCTI